MPSDRLIEEYKSVRKTIFELEKRIDNLTLYTILVTATLLGYAIQDTSFYKPYLFLLPLTIILTVGIKIYSIQGSILRTGTYISALIESKDDDLNWETNLMQIRIMRFVNYFYDTIGNEFAYYNKQF
jgi:hypothetical protein